MSDEAPPPIDSDAPPQQPPLLQSADLPPMPSDPDLRDTWGYGVFGDAVYDGRENASRELAERAARVHDVAESARVGTVEQVSVEMLERVNGGIDGTLPSRPRPTVVPIGRVTEVESAGAISFSAGVTPRRISVTARRIIIGAQVRADALNELEAIGVQLLALEMDRVERVLVQDVAVHHIEHAMEALRLNVAMPDEGIDRAVIDETKGALERVLDGLAAHGSKAVMIVQLINGILQLLDRIAGSGAS